MLRLPHEPFLAHEEDAMRRLADLLSLARTTETYHRERVETARLRERERIADGLHDTEGQVVVTEMGEEAHRVRAR